MGGLMPLSECDIASTPKKVLDKIPEKVFLLDNADFCLQIMTKTPFSGKLTVEFNMGGVSKVEKVEKLK
jgi:hypothetical protein